MFAESLDKIHVAFCTHEEYSVEEVFLKARFENSETIPGTQKFHTIIPISKTKVLAKTFSNSTHESKLYKIMKH